MAPISSWFFLQLISFITSINLVFNAKPFFHEKFIDLLYSDVSYNITELHNSRKIITFFHSYFLLNDSQPKHMYTHITV